MQKSNLYRALHSGNATKVQRILEYEQRRLFRRGEAAAPDAYSEQERHELLHEAFRTHTESPHSGSTEIVLLLMRYWQRGPPRDLRFIHPHHFTSPTFRSYFLRDDHWDEASSNWYRWNVVRETMHPYRLRAAAGALSGAGLAAPLARYVMASYSPRSTAPRGTPGGRGPAPP